MNKWQFLVKKDDFEANFAAFLNYLLLYPQCLDKQDGEKDV